MTIIALTRDISPAIQRAELTHLARRPIDLEVARRQHEAYERALEGAGCTVQRLSTDSTMPDSVFVEDMAVVLDELAVIARPGAESRRAEVAAVAEAVGHYRPVRRIEGPATLDGGDVLVVGRTVFIGRSTRTNAAGLAQLRAIVRPLGYEVHATDVDGCLHLKSALTAIADDILLANRAWIPSADLGGFRVVDTDPEEPLGANALRLGDGVVYAAAFPRTRGLIERCGIRVVAVEMSEIAKAEGAVTCCSILIPT